MNRLCSAVGKTQRALWSWLTRRSRWSQAVSSRSSSAASSSRQPGGRRRGGREPLGQLDIAVDWVADEVDSLKRRQVACRRHVLGGRRRVVQQRVRCGRCAEKSTRRGYCVGRERGS